MEAQAKKRTDLYQIVTDRIINLLEEGVVPWRKTWGSRGFAQNYETKNVYQGINFFMLNMVAPYSMPYYLTWNQIKKLGGNVKKGSKAEYVYFYKEYYKGDNSKSRTEEELKQLGLSTDGLDRIRFLKSYKVFNATCIEGIDFKLPDEAVHDNEEIGECEVFLQSLDPYPEFVSEDLFRAYYCPKKDVINIPPMTSFESSEEFYNCTFHELIHWSGGQKRLERFSNEVTTSSKEYAEEELIAELGASYLCAHTEIDRTPLLRNKVAYLASWIKRLKGDKGLIFRAAPKAQRAAEFLIGKKQ